MGLMRCFSLLLLCALLASVRADRSASLPSLANSLLNAADDILDTEKDQHTGRRTFLSSIIHAAVPGAHRFRPARDEYRPVRPTAVPSAEREAHLRVARAANSGGCGIGYRPNGTANVCTANACTITQLACGASQVDPASYTGDLSVCTVLQVTCANAYTRDLSSAGCSPITMVCNDTVVSATPPATAACSVNTLLCLNPSATLLDFTPSSTPKCSVDELSCNGTLTATPYTDGDGNCSVTRRACATNEDFTVIVSSCLGNGTCTYNSYAAEDPCFIPDTNVPCKCPLDRIGSSCETGRPFTCAFELLSPQPDCKPLLGTGNAPLDGDPPCFTRWKRDEEIQWEYNVRCAFLNTTGLDSYVDDPRFQYFVRVGNTFAISAPTGNTPLVEARFKIFNFNILSDNNASIIVPLNAPQLSGQNPVQFDLLLANVPDKYYAGGRLYFEAGITSNLAGIRKRFDRRFIDPPDAPRVKRTDGGLSGGAIAGIIIACLAGLALIGGGVYLWLRRKRRNEKRLRKAMMQQPR